MKTKAREYLAIAKRCDQRATKVRDAERREWQMILARAYRMLAEAESEATAKRLSAAAKPPRADGACHQPSLCAGALADRVAEL